MCPKGRVNFPRCWDELNKDPKGNDHERKQQAQGKLVTS